MFYLIFFEVMLIACLINISYETPFIFDDTEKYCQYRFENGGTVQATGKPFHLELENYWIYFKLCDLYGEGQDCPAGSVACMKDLKTGKKFNLGSEFRIINDDKFLTSLNGSVCRGTKRYSVQIYPDDLNALGTAAVKKKDDCTYQVTAPLPIYRSKCGVDIYEKHFDLDPLSKSLKTVSKGRNFSLTLCNFEPSCNSHYISACETTGNTVTPLSTTSVLAPVYIGSANQIVFKGHTTVGPNNKYDKRLEVRLKCNWDKTEVQDSDLTYINPPIQGRRYIFELETSYGCVKKNHPCVVREDALVYNLSNLYLKHPQAWDVRDPDDGNSVYFIQVCGPTELRGKNESCRSTLSQVCGNAQGSDANWGSVLSHLEVVNDVVKATIDSGTKCNKDLQRKTTINFICDSEEHEPQIRHFQNQSVCEAHFEWRTPEACPRYNAASCGHIEEASYPCVFNEKGKVYNLTTLEGVRKVQMGEVTFLLNVCGVVLDADAPCTKDVSVAKTNSSEPNVKFRFTSLGKFTESSVIDGDLVLSYSTGGYCDGADYRSQIRIRCIEGEEDPVFWREAKCSYEFLWKTSRGCGHVTVSECFFEDRKTNVSFNFGRIAPMQVLHEGVRVTTFHFCSRLYSSCKQNEIDCPKLKLGDGTVNFSNHSKTVAYNLNTSCDGQTDQFNRVILNFVCEGIKNNQHFDYHLDGCSLKLDYFTSEVCTSQEVPSEFKESPLVYTEKNSDNIHQFLPLGDQNIRLEDVNCSIKSPYTETEVHVRNLTNDFFKSRCPTVTIFNKTFEYVRMLYPTNSSCGPEPSKNISYEVYLECLSDKYSKSKTDDCLFTYTYQNLEYCDLFKLPQTQPTSNSLVITGTILGSVFCLALLTLTVLSRKRLLPPRRTREEQGIYLRDALD